mgnify:FL=1
MWLSILRKQVKDFFIRPYWLIAVVSFLIAYVFLQYIIFDRSIGDAGVYSHHINLSESLFSILINNPRGVFHLISGHITTLAIPFALPIALMISAIITNRNKRIIDVKIYDFLTIVVFFSSALFLLSILFTIKVSPVDLGGLGRWHSRYYFYFYPLIIIAWVVFTERFERREKSNHYIVLGIVALIMITNIYFIKFYDALNNPWFGSIVDNMDIQWYRLTISFYWPFVIFTIALSWLWFKRSAYFKRSLFFFIATWIVVANFGALWVSKVGSLTNDNMCGILSYQFLDHNPGRFVVVGDSRTTMVSASFWNKYIPERAFIYNDKIQPLVPAVVGVSTNYLITNGDIKVDAIYNPLLSIGKCTIYEQRN